MTCRDPELEVTVIVRIYSADWNPVFTRVVVVGTLTTVGIAFDEDARIGHRGDVPELDFA